MTSIIRDPKTGRILGRSKDRPLWANERDLKRVILSPSIRQALAVKMFYQQGRSCKEIARQTGLSVTAIRMVLVRARRGLGNAERYEHVEPLAIAPRGVIEKHKEFASARGFDERRASWGSRGRQYTMVIDEGKLMQFFVGPALLRWEIARLFWIVGLSAKEIAQRLGVKLKSIEFQLARIRKLMQNPQQAQHVSRSVTREGKSRNGITATYTRRQA